MNNDIRRPAPIFSGMGADHPEVNPATDGSQNQFRPGRVYGGSVRPLNNAVLGNLPRAWHGFEEAMDEEIKQLVAQLEGRRAVMRTLDRLGEQTRDSEGTVLYPQASYQEYEEITNHLNSAGLLPYRNGGYGNMTPDFILVQQLHQEGDGRRHYLAVNASMVSNTDQIAQAPLFGMAQQQYGGGYMSPQGVGMEPPFRTPRLGGNQYPVGSFFLVSLGGFAPVATVGGERVRAITTITPLMPTDLEEFYISGDDAQGRKGHYAIQGETFVSEIYTKIEEVRRQQNATIGAQQTQDPDGE